MPDVGEVRYKTQVDNSDVDQQINETEEKIKRAAQKVETAVKSASEASEKAAQSSAKAVANDAEDAADAAKEAAKKAEDSATDANKDIRDQSEKTKDKAKKDGKDTELALSKNWKSVGSVGVSALKGIGKAFVGMTAAAGVGIAAVAKMGVEYNAQMQGYQTAFETMLGDAEKAQKLTENLKALAAKTPMAMADLADASKILLAFGSTAEQLPDQLKRLGDVAQGDAQKLGTMATAFGRIQSNGRASMEEINMMIDQGFNPLNIIAEQTGETMAEVRQRVSDGEVSFEELSEALRIATDEGGQFFNAMENQSKTFDGQMSTLQDNVSALVGTLTEDLFASLAENTLPQLNQWVDELLTAATEEGITGAIDMAGTIVSQALTSLLEAAPSFIETAANLVNSFLTGVQETAPQVAQAGVGLLASLVEGCMKTIPEIIETAVVVMNNFLASIQGELPNVIDAAFDIVLSLIDGLIDMLPELLSAAAYLIVALNAKIIERLPEFAMLGWKLILKIIEGIAGATLSAVQAVADLTNDLLDKFSDVDWSEVGWNILRGINDGIMAGWDWLVNKARNLADSLFTAAKRALGINSPSKKGKWLGQMFDEGVGAGVDDGHDDVIGKVKNLSTTMAESFALDVNYNMPDAADAARDMTANIGMTATTGTTIEVPVSIDGREVARASAWYMGEQLAWEER